MEEGEESRRVGDCEVMGAGNYGWCVAKTEAVPRDKVEYYLHTSLRVSHFSYLHV